MSKAIETSVGFQIEEHSGVSECAIDEVRALRGLCWPEVYAAGSTLEDGFDDDAWHWTIYQDFQMIAAARLTVHQNLVAVPDAHLFCHLDPTSLPSPIGYISRLVVHPSARGQHIAATLDRVRVSKAVELGCKSLVGVWNPRSGERRRQQLVRLGFQSADGETPLDDQGFGLSFVYQMILAVNNDGIHNPR
jgi:GNAT superfamily N-acetyltransferase